MANHKKMTNHTKIRSSRPNGKAPKQFPKGFSEESRSLKTSKDHKGTKF